MQDTAGTGDLLRATHDSKRDCATHGLYQMRRHGTSFNAMFIPWAVVSRCRRLIVSVSGMRHTHRPPEQCQRADTGAVSVAPR